MKNKAVFAIVVSLDLGVYGISVFGIGTDGAMYRKTWNGQEWPPSWAPLGGGFNSAPTASVNGDQFPPVNVNSLGLGRDNQMYLQSVPCLQAPNPVNWQALGGSFISPPDVISWGQATDVNGDTFSNENQAIVGLGTDNQPYLKLTLSPVGWYPSTTDWMPLGGFFNYEAVFANPGGANSFWIFGVGGDRQMYQMSVTGIQAPPSTTAWVASGGCFSSGPAIAMWSPSRIDIFAVGSDGAMHHRPWDNGGWLRDWESLGGSFDSPPAAVAWAANRLDVFGLGLDNQMYHKAWNGTQWLPSITDWEALGGVFNSAPAVVSTGANRLDIFGLGTDNAMYHKSWDGTQWLPSTTTWEALGGVFTVPQSSQTLSRLDFDSQVTFSDGSAIGGPVHVTLFSDGTSVFSGNMHDSGFVDYNYSVVCRVIDAKNNAYQFEQSGQVSGTISLGGNRDSPWSNNGNAVPAIAANWNDLFPCAGAQLTWYARVNVDLTTLLASIGTGGLTSVLNVTFR